MPRFKGIGLVKSKSGTMGHLLASCGEVATGRSRKHHDEIFNPQKDKLQSMLEAVLWNRNPPHTF